MPVMREIPAVFPNRESKPKESHGPWHHSLNIDLLYRVAGYTILHPFVAWIIVLCLRAQLTPYEHLSFKIATAWAFLLTIGGILGIVNERVAYGVPREVDLSDEVIVITGGCSGLGALIAEVYGMRNAQVAVLDTKMVGQEEAEEKGVIYYECDVGDAKQVEAVAAEIVEDLGPPTILINNAGIVHAKSILDQTAKEVESTFRTNTLSHFNTLRTFLPYMLRSELGGTIVTISSVLAHTGAANLSSYSASKAALVALHASLRAELAQHPAGKEIKTILVTPGQLSTKLFEGVKTPNKFWAPIVDTNEIAREIITMVEKGESGDIAVPLYARWIPVLNVLPVAIQRFVRALSGVDKAIGKAGLVKKDVGEKKILI